MLQAIQCQDGNLKQVSLVHSRPSWVWLAVSIGVHLALLLVPMATSQQLSTVTPLEMAVLQIYEVVPVNPEPPQPALVQEIPKIKSVQQPKINPEPHPIPRQDELPQPTPIASSEEVPQPDLEPVPEPQPQLEPQSQPEQLAAISIPSEPEEFFDPMPRSVEDQVPESDTAGPEQLFQPPIDEPLQNQLPIVQEEEVSAETVPDVQLAPADYAEDSNEPEPASESVALPAEAVDPLPLVEEKAEIIAVPPQVLTRTEPVYPIRARRRGWSGEVSVIVQVLADGTAEGVRVVTSSGYPILDEAAVEAVREWSFAPAQEGEQPIIGELSIIVRFALE